MFACRLNLGRLSLKHPRTRITDGGVKHLNPSSKVLVGEAVSRDPTQFSTGPRPSQSRLELVSQRLCNKMFMVTVVGDS